jgi:hypothetical protein
MFGKLRNVDGSGLIIEDELLKDALPTGLAYAASVPVR